MTPEERADWLVKKFCYSPTHTWKDRTALVADQIHAALEAECKEISDMAERKADELGKIYVEFGAEDSMQRAEALRMMADDVLKRDQR